VTQVGITQAGHVRAKDSVSNRNELERYTHNDAILSDEMAESVHQHDTELLWKDTYTELPLELFAILSVAWLPSGRRQCMP
jgi:hypothetical protein